MKGLKTFVDDDGGEEDEEKSVIASGDREKSALAQLILQSENHPQEKGKSFDDLTSLNKKIKSFNEQVRFSLPKNRSSSFCLM